MDEWEKIALSYLSTKARSAVAVAASLWNKPISEIRLRKDKPLCLTLESTNVKIDYVCTANEISETSSRLCQGSLYSYAENIKEGVIATEYGIRAGVCGRAVMRDGTLSCVRDITSINIRIPHRIIGASNALYELVVDCGSVLVCSAPGRGKTTLLRELIPVLSSGANAKRVSVIDSRLELFAGMRDCDMADFFIGYPRQDGIISAVRTMSPEYVICDEIASERDADAVRIARSAGVNVVVSAHAGSFTDLRKNRYIKELLDSHMFGALYGITDKGHEVLRLDE